MFKLFKRKTEEEKQLEFIDCYKASSYKLEKLCEVISSTPRPFEVSEWIEYEICLSQLNVRGLKRVLLLHLFTV